MTLNLRTTLNSTCLVRLPTKPPIGRQPRSRPKRFERMGRQLYPQFRAISLRFWSAAKIGFAKDLVVLASCWISRDDGGYGQLSCRNAGSCLFSDRFHWNRLFLCLSLDVSWFFESIVHFYSRKDTWSCREKWYIAAKVTGIDQVSLSHWMLQPPITP